MAKLRSHSHYFPNAGKITPPFTTFKIDIAKEKKNGATVLDIEAYKLFNASNERTLTSCYREIAHAKETRILALEDAVIDLGGDIREVKNG